MYSSVLRNSLIIACTIALTGCSSLYGQNNFISKSENQYLQANDAPLLRLPAGINPNSLGNNYAIPAPSSKATLKPNLTPPGSLAEKIAADVVPASVLKEKIVANKTEKTTENIVTSNTSVAVSGSTLEFNQNSEQVWKKVGDNLKAAGYPVVNDNQQEKLYYFLNASATGGKVKKETPIYQLHLRDTTNGSEAYLTNSNGNPLDTQTTQHILSDLNDAFTGKIPSPMVRWFKEAFPFF